MTDIDKERMRGDKPNGGCPWCGFLPKGGFKSYSEKCPVCGVARDGSGGEKVEDSINSPEGYQR